MKEISHLSPCLEDLNLLLEERLMMMDGNAMLRGAVVGYSSETKPHVKI